MQKSLNFSDKMILFFSRLGIAGLSPKAPGTCGTALACLLAPFLFFPLDYMWRILLLGAIFMLGGLAANRAEKLLDKKDPGEVVIDELAGVWLAMLPFKAASFWLLLSAFVCFRIFDIAKPWPVHASENWLPGGFGIMIDDIMAGLYAMGCLGVLGWLKII